MNTGTIGWDARVLAGIHDIKGGMPVARAAKKHGVSYPTMRRRWLEYQAAHGNATAADTTDPWLQRRLKTAAATGALPRVMTLQETADLGRTAIAERPRETPGCVICKEPWDRVTHQAHDHCTSCYNHEYYEAHK